MGGPYNCPACDGENCVSEDMAPTPASFIKKRIGWSCEKCGEEYDLDCLKTMLALLGDD